jgi:hypothetical protein
MGEFSSDERAIEGLPIRLVIALVVGVAALSMMMTILDGVGQVGQTELHYESEDSLTFTAAETVNPTLQIRDEEGNGVTGAEVIISSGTAQLDTPQQFTASGGSGGGSGGTPSGAGHEISISISAGNVELRQGQDIGTLEVTIIPPGDSNYADNEANRKIRILATSA